MATRTKPDGGALASIMERFLTDAVRDAEATKVSVDKVIDAKLAPLQDEVGGYDYTVVLKAYLRGSENGDDHLKTGALRWIRGEFTTKTEARSVVPVRNIIDDANVYDSLKLLGSFVKLAGYGGLLVVFDEMVNLYKLQHRRRATRTTSRFSASSTTPFKATSAPSASCSEGHRSS